jgi:hypothetical protein
MGEGKDMEDDQVTGEIPEAAAQEEIIQEDVVQEEAPEQQVPLSALQAERSERQRMQEEIKLIKDHMSLIQANQQDQKREPNQQIDDTSNDDDVLTVGEAKKYLSEMNSSYSSSIQELKMVQKHPDYQDVIMKHLPEVLKENPSLRRTLEKSNDYELAYFLAKNSAGYRGNETKKKKSDTAQRIIENSQQVGNLSSMGASTPVQMVKNYKNMSDDDFSDLVNKNMGFA